MSSHLCQSFIKPGGIYTPTRGLYGTANALIYLQDTLLLVLPYDLRANVMWCLNNMLIHDGTFENHLSSIFRLLCFCQ